MSYALVTGGDLWYTLGLSLASIPAGSIMFYTHEWVWDKLDISKMDKYLVESIFSIHRTL